MVRNRILAAAATIFTLLLVFQVCFLPRGLSVERLLDSIPMLEIRSSTSNSTEEREKLVAFYKMNSSYRIAPQYHLATCHITKLGSTIITAVLCYLFDSEYFLNANRTIETEAWETRFCALRNEVFELPNLAKRMGSNNYNVIVLVRNPIERFVSGFVDKCINEKNDCLGCYQDLRCFVTRLYDTLKYSPANTETMPHHYIHAHFAPQTWYCSANIMMDKVKYIKYGNSGDDLVRMIDELASEMRNRKVEEYKIEHISSVMKRTRSKHSTNGSQVSEIMKAIIMQDEFLQMMIKKMYHYDFELYKIVSNKTKEYLLIINTSSLVDCIGLLLS